MNQNERALGVEGIVQDIRALLRHDAASIDERPMMMLQKYCDELLEYAGSLFLSTRRAAMTAISSLTKEDPLIRKMLENPKEIRRLANMAKSTKPDIAEWASRALSATNGGKAPGFRSNAIIDPNAKPENFDELLAHVLETAPKDSLEDLSGRVQVDFSDDNIMGEGGFSAVYKGTINRNSMKVDVAVKRLKTLGSKVAKILAKELRVASRLNHPNVLSPFGYMIDGDDYCIVSAYMERGTLRSCMARLSKHDLFDMSLGISKGLWYLHSINIIHGDLKADNVLVSPSREPLLTDFGLSRARESSWSRGWYSTKNSQLSPRWIAYEFYHLKDTELFRPNQQTDIWAFGMTLVVCSRTNV